MFFLGSAPGLDPQQPTPINLKLAMSRVEIMSGWIHFFMIGVVLDPQMLEVKSCFSEHAWPADKHAQRRLRRFRPAPPVSAPHRGVVSEGTAASPPFFPSSLIFPAAGADACDGASRFAAVFAGTMGEACEAMFSNSLQRQPGSPPSRWHASSRRPAPSGGHLHRT